MCDVSGEKRYNLRDFDYFVSLIKASVGEARAVKVADALLSKYITIENAIGADVKELEGMCGESAAVLLKLMGYITSRRVTDKFTFGKKHTMAEIADYFKAKFIGQSVEAVYIMSLDSNDRVISCELASVGTVNASSVTPRRLLELAMSRKAAKVILAHNHPQGKAVASSEDINFTYSLSNSFANIGVELVSHIIVAGQICGSVEMPNDTNKQL